MPAYLFEHIKTGEVHEVFYHMNDTKDYAGPDAREPGLWRRVWTKPRASFDTRVDPYSAKDYLKATARDGKVGDLWDRSKEMSLKRAEKEGGTDPVRRQFFADYSAKRKGRKHPEQAREDGVKSLAAKGIKLDWGSDD